MSKINSSTAIVVVTYKRKELLKVLFDSYLASTVYPGNIYIVDNDKDPEVGDMCRHLQENLRANVAAVGNSEDGSHADSTPMSPSVNYIPMETNTGGAGGFSKGVESAYKAGAEWIWVMDDDVKVLPHGLETLEKWMKDAVADDHRVIQCRRMNYDDTPFYWQYHFWNKLGIPNPVAPADFKPGETQRPMNTACFEGGLFHRSIVDEIGIPDNRFFIYWDDTVYGYLASKVTNPILVVDILMQRTRHIDNIKIGSARKLNSTSDMVRYYIMRNRGYIAHYLKLNGEYNPIIFGFGTFLTFSKETIRLVITKNFRQGMASITRGMKDGKIARRDKTWKPMKEIQD
ncbi:MAG: glycosyltransferase [Clostridiales Family XIII bacterium]|jgi:GT2 family glycosyltransferase|nr:glycosyltransferase [Clostridiales Family XIII bacterium]